MIHCVHMLVCSTLRRELARTCFTIKCGSPVAKSVHVLVCGTLAGELSSTCLAFNDWIIVVVHFGIPGAGNDDRRKKEMKEDGDEGGSEVREEDGSEVREEDERVQREEGGAISPQSGSAWDAQLPPVGSGQANERSHLVPRLILTRRGVGWGADQTKLIVAYVGIQSIHCKCPILKQNK